MAYESIDVHQLKNAINHCKETLNHSITDSLMGNIANDDVWHADSRNTLRNSLGKVQNIYNDLENTLNSYMSIALEIEKYKNMQAENAALNNECNNLQSRLYYNETYYEEYKDPKTGKNVREYKNRRVKDYNVENKINSNRGRINNNNSAMESIVRRLSSSV